MNDDEVSWDYVTVWGITLAYLGIMFGIGMRVFLEAVMR
jgi:hypothetical protein